MTSPRLPPLPELSWKPDGTPVSEAMGDIYFSVEDGLAETREIFLKACGLPDRWKGCAQFTVGELGFGTGLNFLALWDLWRQARPGPEARLHFVSFEGFPLDRESAARALGKWPDLEDLAHALVTAWPNRARGVRRIAFPDGVHLTLHVDEVGDALARSSFKADAWFLDGFAPAKNAAMWSEQLYPLIAERSARGAIIGTYTVAGAVRRGLATAGFDVEKAPGHGRKRERLHAVLPEAITRTPDPYGMEAQPDLGQGPQTVAIIGAGIAGASTARALLDRGIAVTVFDSASESAAGASGNPMALVMPRLDVGDGPQARALIDAYLYTRTALKGRPGVIETETEQRPRDAAEASRFAKLMSDPPLAGEDLVYDAEGTLRHLGALIVKPHLLLPDLLKGAECMLGAPVDLGISARTVNGRPFDAIVLANGVGLSQVPAAAWLPVEARLGQVEYGNGPDQSTYAIAAGHYALAAGTERLWGATFEPSSEACEPRVHAAATAANMKALSALVGNQWDDVSALSARAGLRATTPDRLPMVGPLPDIDAAIAQFASVRNGLPPMGSPPIHSGIYLMAGLGSRGFTFAPWMAEGLASRLCCEPSPFSRDVALALSPLRFLFRRLKRREI